MWLDAGIGGAWVCASCLTLSWPMPLAQRSRFSISVAMPMPEPRHMLITA